MSQPELQEHTERGFLWPMSDAVTEKLEERLSYDGVGEGRWGVGVMAESCPEMEMFAEDTRDPSVSFCHEVSVLL